MSKPNILIAVPAYRGDIKRLCAEQLVAICLQLQRDGIQSGLSTVDGNDIAQVRNGFASGILLKPEFTALLFIDNDMVPSVTGILRMIAADKPVVGWIAPVRPNGGRETKMRFNVQRDDISDYNSATGICRVSRIGTGVCLIKTSVFRKLADTGKLRVETRHNFNIKGPVYGFFDRIDTTYGARLTEDWSFCDRWRELCGGEIYALANEDIGHIGEQIYRGKVFD